MAWEDWGFQISVSRNYSVESPGPGRSHGLDTVRAFALLMVVFYHAAVAYLPVAWLVDDPESSLPLTLFFFVANMFQMPVFFLIAGYFGRMILDKRGVQGFIKDRAKRILAPLVIAWPFALLGNLGAASFGVYLATEEAGPIPLPSIHDLPSFPLTHLWFLYVLLIFYAATLIGRGLMLRIDRRGKLIELGDRFTAWLAKTPVAPAILAVPVFLVFCGRSNWIAWFGVPTPDHSLIPNLPALAQDFAVFGFGWLLSRQPRLLDVFARRWAWNLALAIVATVLSLAMAGVVPRIENAPRNAHTVVYAACYAVGAWSWTLAAVGMAMRFLSAESPVRRYIADASYWIYIVHLPLVLLLQAVLTQVELPAEVKFTIVLLVAMPVLFASYHLLVRRTVIGAVLNGRRVGDPPPEGVAAAA